MFGSAARYVGAHFEVLADAHEREQCPALRHMGQARLDPLMRRQLSDVGAVQQQVPLLTSTSKPERALSDVVLPAPLAPSKDTMLSGGTLKLTSRKMITSP